MLDGYTDIDMAGDIDSRKFTSRYMMTFAGGRCLGNQDYKSVLLNLLQRLSILQQLVRVNNFCG